MWALKQCGFKFCSSWSAPSSVNEVSTEALETLEGIESGVTLEPPATGAALVVASGHQAGTRHDCVYSPDRRPPSR